MNASITSAWLLSWRDTMTSFIKKKKKKKKKSAASEAQLLPIRISTIWVYNLKPNLIDRQLESVTNVLKRPQVIICSCS